jgi:thiamine biosynthesis lipoprotein
MGRAHLSTTRVIPMSSSQRVYSYTATLMGSPILLKLFENSPHVAQAVFRLIKQHEDQLTVNREQSQLMAINHAAGQHSVTVSRSVFELIRQAKAVSLMEGSCFNLAIGPLVKRWKIGFHGNSIPAQADLQSLLRLTDPTQIILNEETCAVFLTQAGMEIDLGAIAKGYIADQVRHLLHQMGIEHALINLGGNVLTLGSPQHSQQTAWGIGLQKPFAAPEVLLGVIEVNGKSVVTSGVYERYFELDGKIYHHILDPKTGYPLDNELLSVTVISDNSIDGDIYTTLLYGMGVADGLRFLSNQPHMHIEAIFVTRDRRVICSSQRQFSFTLTDNDYQQA